ncbi:DUF4291 domain-containing protein [Polaromonas sp. Pch-P]|uniref:DUF4291 domain-containing protein n=1 Tax=Polaromonas sp. Pch-P TaxID=2082385 RepID=UPI001E32A7FA|nr:DUF4291 domain-containing protein [Polaromonas sp. Pch-P]
MLAHHDADTIVVYQAYRPSTAAYAVAHGQLGGPDFSFDRMSWIKPNFLWMMYRSGWGSKEGQEGVLGLRLRRTFFDSLLAGAVPSTFDSEAYASPQEWQTAVAASNVRRQRDPDHAPSGANLARRAIQLGLRGEALRALATTELLEVIDMSSFVASQRLQATDDDQNLLVPVETVYTAQSPA